MYALQLSFLKDTIQPRATSSSLDFDNVQSPEIIDNNSSASLEKETPSIKTTERRATEIGKKRKLPYADEKLLEAIENNAIRRENKERLETIHRQNREKLDDDEDRHFLLSLLSQLKSLPLHLKFHTRIEMLQVLQKNALQAASAAPVNYLPYHQYHQQASSQLLYLQHERQNPEQHQQIPKG